MENNDGLCNALPNDRDLLKRGINDLLDRVPLENLKSLYVHTLEAAFP